MSPIEVYIDFRSPAAYLAMQPTLELIAATGTKATWFPARTKQRDLAKQKTGETKSETHFRVREEYRRRANQHYASVQGIPFQYPKVIGETELALVALEHNRSLAFAELCFAAYWQNGADLNDAATIDQLASRAGTTPLPAENEHEALAEAISTRQIERGVIDAPAYVIGEDLFIGREHLPWVRTLIEGS